MKVLQVLILIVFLSPSFEVQAQLYKKIRCDKHKYNKLLISDRGDYLFIFDGDKFYKYLLSRKGKVGGVLVEELDSTINLLINNDTIYSDQYDYRLDDEFVWKATKRGNIKIADKNLNYYPYYYKKCKLETGRGHCGKGWYYYLTRNDEKTIIWYDTKIPCGY